MNESNMENITFSLQDSDEEDLPDLFSSKTNESEKKSLVLRQGDIVWAEFRKLYWPSLVRRVDKKRRKASIWYLDSPKKCFKVPFKKIKSFSDPEIHAAVREEIDKSPAKALHKKVWLNAITFIRRQAEGYEDDPAAYFDLSRNYLAFKNFTCDDYVTESITTIESLKHRLTSESEDSDEESLLCSEDEESRITDQISKFSSKSTFLLHDSREDEAKTEPIVKCIVAGLVDKHLLHINAKKIPSQYQKLFEEAMKTNRNKLFDTVTFDVILTSEQLRDVSFYLMNLYEKIVGSGKCEMIDYITSVWLPESVNKAAKLVTEGAVDSDDVTGLKRRLFPTDQLLYGKEEDFVTLSQEKTKANLSPKTPRNKNKNSKANLSPKTPRNKSKNSKASLKANLSPKTPRNKSKNSKASLCKIKKSPSRRSPRTTMEAT